MCYINNCTNYEKIYNRNKEWSNDKVSNIYCCINFDGFYYAKGMHHNGRKWRETKQPLDEGERRKWKAGLKLNIQKLR